MSTARDLRIGDRYGHDRSGHPVKIKALHELCSRQRAPHVHVVTSQADTCLPFNAPLGRKQLAEATS